MVMTGGGSDTGIEQGEARDTVEHPVLHRTVPTTVIWSHVSLVPCSKHKTINLQSSSPKYKYVLTVTKANIKT